MSYANSLYLTGAEVGLSIAGLALLLATAWTSRASARTITIAAVAALFGALIFNVSQFDNGVGAYAFGGLLKIDAFSVFAKSLVYIATIACLIVAPRYFHDRGQFRGEYAVLFLFNAVGMGLMVNNTVGQIQGFLSSGGEFVRTPKLASTHDDVLGL